MRRADARRLALAFAFALCAQGCEHAVPGAPARSGASVEPTEGRMRGEGARSGWPALLAERRAPYAVAVFGFTGCPDVCPAALWRWREALGSLTPASADAVRVLFVTVDPARDTRAVLDRYVSHFDASFVGVRAEGEALKRLLRPLHAYARKVPSSTPGRYAMDHTATAFLLDRAGRVIEEFRHGTPVANIVRRLEALFADGATLAALERYEPSRAPDPAGTGRPAPTLSAR